MFPSIFNSDNNDSKLESIVAKPFSTIEYEIDIILYKIKNIDNISIDEIKDIIIKQHNLILNYDLFFMDSSTRESAQKLFTNKRFLKSFLDVIGLIDLSQHETICLNKVAYDYYIIGNYDHEVSEMLFNLTSIINTKMIVNLSGIIGIDRAKILVMLRFSSFQDNKNVKRVNNFLMHCDVPLRIQDIINIYCFLFQRVSNLFIYTMLEEKNSNLSAEQYKRFDQISIAILEIINSLPYDDIYRVMNDYGYLLSMNHYNVRFRLKTAVSYPRIVNAVKAVEIHNDNIVIP